MPKYVQKCSYVDMFKRSIAAGVCIGIGCAVYLNMLTACKPFGAILFAVGLLTILRFKFLLFTGYCPYMFDGMSRKSNSKDSTFDLKANYTCHYLYEMYIVWFGNLVGCALVGKLLALQEVVPYQKYATMLWGQKSLYPCKSLLILGIFCGILMFIAVDTYKKEEVNHVLRCFIVLMCVSTFILSGFEHCVADMGYLLMSGFYHPSNLVPLFVITIGNVIGGVLANIVSPYRKVEKL